MTYFPCQTQQRCRCMRDCRGASIWRALNTSHLGWKGEDGYQLVQRADGRALTTFCQDICLAAMPPERSRYLIVKRDWSQRVRNTPQATQWFYSRYPPIRHITRLVTMFHHRRNRKAQTRFEPTRHENELQQNERMNLPTFSKCDSAIGIRCLILWTMVPMSM